MERTISVRSNRNIWDHLRRWSPVRQARSFLSIVPKCPFPFHKIVVRSTAPLSLADNYNNQTRGWLGSGLCNGMYRSIRLVKLTNFHKRNFCWTESAAEFKGLQNDRCSDQPHNLSQRSLLRMRFSCFVTHSFPWTCGGRTRDEDLRKSA